MDGVHDSRFTRDVPLNESAGTLRDRVCTTRRRIARLGVVGAAFLCLALSACYQVDQEIITPGIATEVPGLEGTLVVPGLDEFTSAFDGTRNEYVWHQAKPDGRTEEGRVRAVLLRDDMWVFQLPDDKKPSSYTVVFLRFDRQRRQLDLAVPDREVEDLERFASRFGVHVLEQPFPHPPKLVGKRADILDFLLVHRDMPFVTAHGVWNRGVVAGHLPSSSKARGPSGVNCNKNLTAQ